jgi:uncharacterized protein (UPF0335 family)
MTFSAETMSNTATVKSFVERIERLQGERDGYAADIREVYAEAKSQGFDPKILRKVVRASKAGREKVAEERALEETYLAALGLLD